MKESNAIDGSAGVFAGSAPGKTVRGLRVDALFEGGNGEPNRS